MTAMAAALGAAGFQPTPAEPTKLDQVLEKVKKKKSKKGAKKSRRRWNAADASQQSTITWSHEIGTVQFVVRQFRLGHIHKSRGVYWAEITATRHAPEEIVVDVTTNLAEGVIPFYTKGGQVIDCGDGPVPSLQVPVVWKKTVPHTRQRDMDNADLILRLPNGEFIDLQFAILTRNGTFYLSIQEISSGQIIKLPDEVVDEDVGYTKVAHQKGTFIVVPLYADHAYPGADFLKNVMPRSGPKFVAMAADDDAYTEATEIEYPMWEQPDFPKRPGATGGVMLWFNPIIGGKALCDDGVECFIPLQVIQNDFRDIAMKVGDYPILVSRQQVLLQHSTSDKGRAATSLEAVPLPEDE